MFSKTFCRRTGFLLLAVLLLGLSTKYAQAQEKKETPSAEEKTPIKFEKQSPGKELRQLSSEDLDALLQRHVGSLPETEPIDDTQFLRRVSLDLTGRPPTPKQIEGFLSDESANKRPTAIDRLLASPAFGENWADYWSDVISYRTPEPQLTFLNYQTLKKWLAEQLNQNTTWDEITFRMLTASGKVSEHPEATFIGFHQADRARLAAETSRIFLGVQIQCAQCHDHPFVDIPQETFHQMAAFFVRVEAKLPWNDSNGIEVKSKEKGEHTMPDSKEPMRPVAFDSRPLDLSQGDLQRRTSLAQWIVSPENAYFAKAYVNRIWAMMMGRGFCEPVDEIGQAADPLLPEIHEAVAQHFVAGGYDTKDLYRLIAGTKAYQRGLKRLIPDYSLDPDAEKKALALALPQRLRGDEVFRSLVLAIELPNVTPPPVPANDAYRFPPPPKSTHDLVNRAFGFDPSLSKTLRPRTMQQAMFLMNNEQLQKQINASPESGTMLAKLLQNEKDDLAAINYLYIKVLARKPAEKEQQILLRHLANLDDRQAAFEDMLWSLVNSTEFTTRH